MNPIKLLTDEAFNSDGTITHASLRTRLIHRNISSQFASDALFDAAFAILALVSLILVTCFLWMKLMEYRAARYHARHTDLPHIAREEEGLNEEEESRLRSKILGILPKKVCTCFSSVPYLNEHGSIILAFYQRYL